MNLKISYSKELDAKKCVVQIVDSVELLKPYYSEKELVYISEKRKKKEYLVTINRLDVISICVFPDLDAPDWRRADKLRIKGDKVQKIVAGLDFTFLQVVNLCSNADDVVAFVEGAILGSYDFKKYKTNAAEHVKLLSEIQIIGSDELIGRINEVSYVAESVFRARNWVNEPVITLTAPEFAKQIKDEADKVGLSAMVHGKDWIVSENMGGLLAVNYGSIDEPRFTVLEWKPENATNKKPLVFVGKGIVYDTGGISLKSSSSMEWMKADMGGAAAIAGAMLAIAENKLPVHVVALIPSTDNRPGGNAYVPGDVITMRNGKTVEVLNTDAEGRMILADGLNFADQYSPDLVIDVATLTGAAANAVSDFAVVTMGTADETVFQRLDQSGFAVCERLVRFPFWDEYGEMIKSDIADMKNVGGPTAGAITAGKFLEHFVESPWIHIDISGSAFLKTESGYRGKGGTGFGVRLLYDFVKRNYLK